MNKRLIIILASFLAPIMFFMCYGLRSISMQESALELAVEGIFEEHEEELDLWARDLRSAVQIAWMSGDDHENPPRNESSRKGARFQSSFS